MAAGGGSVGTVCTAAGWVGCVGGAGVGALTRFCCHSAAGNVCVLQISSISLAKTGLLRVSRHAHIQSPASATWAALAVINSNVILLWLLGYLGQCSQSSSTTRTADSASLSATTPKRRVHPQNARDAHSLVVFADNLLFPCG